MVVFLGSLSKGVIWFSLKEGLVMRQVNRAGTLLAQKLGLRQLGTLVDFLLLTPGALAEGELGVGFLRGFVHFSKSRPDLGVFHDDHVSFSEFLGG